MIRLLIILFVFAVANDSKANSSRPNIILIMCDDLGWGDVGFNGNKIIKTPNLDSMANSGIKFDRFYAAAPVCSPTRGSVLTGRHPFRYGIYYANTGHMKEKELTLAEIMKTKGYRTGHFGKWHLGTLTTKIKDANRGGPKGAKHYSPPQDNGFDICFSTESKVPTWDPMIVPKKFSNGASRRKWWNPVTDTKNTEHYGTHYWDQNGKVITANLTGSNSRVIMDRAIPFMKDCLKSKSPFFSVIWFHTPHLPVIAGPKYTKMYQSYSKYQQHYFGCITAMDEQIGRLRKTLKEAGAHRNTMIWFCSDNGPEGNESAPGKTGGFRGRKRSLYEGGVRVPALLEWPEKITKKDNITCPAGTIDYLPTILSLMDIQLPDQRPIDGINLIPIITKKGKSRGKSIGFQSNSVASLITDRYKIILKKKNNTVELFDILNDPFEKNDISLTMVDKASELKAELNKWIASCSESDQGKDYPKITGQ